MSGRSSRLISETDTTPTAMTPTDQESLPPFPSTDFINHDETVVEISIDTSYTDGKCAIGNLNRISVLSSRVGQINQTLPFTPMNIVSQIDIDGNKNIIADEQQSPLISTLEKREELEKAIIEPTVLISSETIIPITIDVDLKPAEEPIELKIVCQLLILVSFILLCVN